MAGRDRNQVVGPEQQTKSLRAIIQNTVQSPDARNPTTQGNRINKHA